VLSRLLEWRGELRMIKGIWCLRLSLRIDVLAKNSWLIFFLAKVVIDTRGGEKARL
jgi:hypothetical protein